MMKSVPRLTLSQEPMVMSHKCSVLSACETDAWENLELMCLSLSRLSGYLARAQADTSVRLLSYIPSSTAIRDVTDTAQVYYTRR